MLTAWYQHDYQFNFILYIWIFQHVTEAESKKLWMCVFKCQDRSGKDPNVQPLESAAEKRRLLTMGKTATRIFTVTTAVSAIAPKILHNAEGASGRHVASACEWGPGRQAGLPDWSISHEVPWCTTFMQTDHTLGFVSKCPSLEHHRDRVHTNTGRF